MIIRKFRPDDAEGLIDFDDKPSKRRWEKLRAACLLSSFYAYVSEDDGELLGFIIMEDLGDMISHYMVQINVKDGDKRRGIGTKLVKMVFGHIGPGGHVSLCVNTDNDVAIKFYESLEFKKSGFTKGYRKDQNKLWYSIDL